MLLLVALRGSSIKGMRLMLNRTILLATFLLCFPWHGFAERSCSLSDLQSCTSCPGLKSVLDLSKPDFGEYYRGAYWNGLFAAYRLNCLSIGKDLLAHGANPNLGGASGSFLATLVQAWPHHDIQVNKKWTELVLKYRIDPTWKNPWTNESAQEVVANQEVTLDYKGLWDQLTSARRSK